MGEVCLQTGVLLSVVFLCSLTGWIRSYIIQCGIEIGDNRRVFGPISKITEMISKDAKSTFLLLKSKRGRKLARRGRISKPPAADATNQRWCMDFVTERFENGRYFRILTVMDQYTRECLILEPGVSMTGTKVAHYLTGAVLRRGSPESITMDNGTEFQSRAMDAWAYQNDVRLDFIRPGRPVENGLIESFNGRLRDECLNIHLFWTMEDAREKLEEWRLDYNSVRPHSSLGQLTPEEYAASVSG